ncbi:adenosylcobinamide-GDP ribazoletransferase [Vibrio aestuarianus]|uniref:adenosylcobinamide-GDP ribazoletransferase n=1 Tax=Vibrio aestuarianus TaxID=28171 RepID=UPI00237CA95B|nr:adenosylcobinamide-GDP ribazoletransferase [Vibrio aestuarianus]MDE1339862.1 adenosylcobinamide-GDP ribazoletransferase [Vibrio aestuarianus]
MLSALKYQLELFWLTLSFFSRLPIPEKTPYSSDRMNRSGRYFALVGLLLGAICATCYSVLSLIFPAEVSIALTMVISLLLTGAFHEDGLTDMADGIGGGMTVERRLAIMKDSRIGTYGASALVMALLCKYLFLSTLVGYSNLFVVWLVGYGYSRAIAASLIFDMPYVSDLDTSKSKPLANKQTFSELCFLLLCGLLPCFWLGLPVVIALIGLAIVFRTLFKSWLMARIGGFTGDCLGAAQQIMELLIYLLLIAFAQYGFLTMGVIE